MDRTYDFSGWATRNDLKCSDGRIIRKDAFKENDGKTVPLVWNHQHNDPNNVLGHALLENRNEGVYAYGWFNDNESGQVAKGLVQSGDVKALSIYANQLKQNGSNVMHGAIREVSLVLAGANPGAYIESIIAHGEESDEEAIIYTDELISFAHSEEKAEVTEEKEEVKEPPKEEENAKMADKEKTVGDVIDSMTEEQKNVMYALIGQALEEAGVEPKDEDTQEDEEVKHNVFDGSNEYRGDVLSHSEMQEIIADGKRYGSLKDSVLAHGIEHIDYLFPEAKNLDNTPGFIDKDNGWVQKVMNGVHHTPFSRIKSTFADITGEEARAKGYMKGKLKKEEVFTLLKRTTTPTTIYKKQKLDRDDVVDITDFDVVAWLKAEMRQKLDEEIARAILIGDGRLTSSDDKINEQNIRPIVKDESLYNIKVDMGTGAETSDIESIKSIMADAPSVETIGMVTESYVYKVQRAIMAGRTAYQGSGSPKYFTTESELARLLLSTDGMGRPMYDNEEQLARALRVSEIVTVPVLEGVKTDDGAAIVGIVVNLSDYNVGADKGGAVNMFDDFDIDYNAQKYLIETRCSGALIKPYSAITIVNTPKMS